MLQITLRAILVVVFCTLNFHSASLSARRVSDTVQPVSIDMPEGGTMRIDQGSSRVENGQGSLVYWVKVPGGAKDIKQVYGLFDQVSKQYKNFKKLDELEAQLSGSRGFVVIVGGINPRGNEVITKVVAAPFGDDFWTVFASAPVDRFQNVQVTLDQIIGSFRVGEMTSIGRAPEGPKLGAIYRFEPSVIVDPYGQAKPIAAFSLFIPHGWRTQGGINCGAQHACTNYFNSDWSATSPDGTSVIGSLPQAGWEMDNTGHNRALKIGCTH